MICRTRIEPWIPVAGFEAVPELSKILDEVKARDTAAAAVETNAPLDAGKPVALYNGMIHPVVPFGIKGALWYQGESNGGEGEEYYHKMRALVGGWRKVWAQGDFPFYFVQLANFGQLSSSAGEDGWARVREAQRAIAEEDPKVALAVTIDAGEKFDIHPPNKSIVAARAFQAAREAVYGEKLAPSGPRPVAAKLAGSQITISFQDYSGALMAASANRWADCM